MYNNNFKNQEVGIIYPILPKNCYSSVLNYIKDLELSINKVNIFVDIQNIASVHNNLELYYKDTNFSEIFNQILYEVVSIVESFKMINLLPHVIIYTDNKRNIYNTNLYHEWKNNRKKNLMDDTITEKDKLTYESSVVLKELLSLSLKSLSKLFNNSKRLSIIELENIDSDFVPALVKSLINDETCLNLIVSTDHDYIHMIDNKNTVRYSRVHKKFYENFPVLETLYTKNIFLKEKEDIKDLEIAKKIAKYYQIFHGLAGDSTDNVKPIIPKKGLKKWAKELEFNNENTDIIVDKILRREYKIFEDDVNNTELIKRILMFDFNVMSKLFMYYLLDKSEYQYLIDLMLSLAPQNLNVIKDNVEIVKKILFVPRQKIENFDIFINTFHIKDEYINSLFY